MLYSFELPASPSHGQFPVAKFRCKLSPSCQVMFSTSHSRYSLPWWIAKAFPVKWRMLMPGFARNNWDLFSLASHALRARKARALRAQDFPDFFTDFEKKNRLFCNLLFYYYTFLKLGIINIHNMNFKKKKSWGHRACLRVGRLLNWDIFTGLR